MKILISGAAGFIGSNLTMFLLNKGHHVCAIDNFSQGGKAMLYDLRKQKKFKIYSIDLIKTKTLNIVGEGFDVVIHLAAKKIPRYENSLSTLLDNTKMTQLMLYKARQNKSKFIFASTSDVYGLNNKPPFKEDSNLVLGPPTVSRWAYAVSKIFDEHLCLSSSDKYKFPVVILRFFGVYGPGVNLNWWGGPLGPFISSIITNKQIEVHGNGKQIRCFTYIDDIVRGIYLSIISKKTDGTIINLASEEKISILNLVKSIEKVSGKKAKIKIVPYSSFYGGKYQDVMFKIPDTKRAKNLMNFETKTSLKKGIEKTIQWYLSKE